MGGEDLTHLIGDDLVGFKYSPQTGNVYRNPNGSGRRKPGVITSRNTHGYLRFQIGGRAMSCHRFAFHCMGIRLTADDHIDHINGVRSDNRWVNLRISSIRKNQQNRPSHRSGTPVGARRRGDWFYSSICYKGKKYYLGRFLTAEEATAAHKIVNDVICNHNCVDDIESIIRAVRLENGLTDIGGNHK